MNAPQLHKAVLILGLAAGLGLFAFVFHATRGDPHDLKWTATKDVVQLGTDPSPGAIPTDLRVALFDRNRPNGVSYAMAYLGDNKVATWKLETSKINGRLMDYRRLPSGRVVSFVLSGSTYFLCDFPEKPGLQPTCRAIPHLDGHDLVELPDRGMYLMFYMPRTDAGSLFERRLVDLVIRRYDRDWKAVWEWSSREHISLNEYVANAPPEGLYAMAHGWVQLSLGWLLHQFGVEHQVKIPFMSATTKPFKFDYIHGNSMALDTDGGIIVSARDTNSVFKIDVGSGTIAWRLGGYQAKRSDFQMVGDALGGFSRQHSAIPLAGGNLLIFDNGDMRPDKHSRAVEYRLDFTKREAHLVWEYRAGEAYRFRPTMGSVQRLKDGTTVIGWGTSSSLIPQTEPLATAVDPTGRVLWKLSSPNGLYSYRVWVSD